MTVTVDIPDKLVEAFAPNGGDLSRAVLEAMVLDGNRRRLLGESQMRRLLGFGTRIEVHGFLREHGVFLNYEIEDVEHDLLEIRRYGELTPAEQATSQRPAE